MALTPQNNDAFLREVDDELRREKVSDIGRRYGLWIIGAVIAALVAFGAWTFWQHRQTQQAGEQGEQLATALDDIAAGRAAQADAAVAKLTTSDRDAVRATALLTQADMLLSRKDLKGAAAAFAKVAADESLAQPFRDLALVRQTSVEYDSLQPQQVIDRLRGLADKGSPWLGSAGEMVAVAYIRQNKLPEAGRLYGLIAQTEGVPQSLRGRAVQMAGSLGVDAVDQSGPANQTAAQ
ncbi:tetratricopeptide repeat protein [Sphingomonas sp. CFBP 13720]|uniref:tetratricopeptide repeat protein n=1 Tax=Sphingomonas sp. CFBP 13720 TaxID=2775302 RepID=UPI001781D85A|nr:tetratricopeptide repeat protein [Sphingomonas sp. CFBP 13720]MBD8677628.1 tetratricopeptide repeat protein [Sphingomonas sp. CFBP 13720]